MRWLGIIAAMAGVLASLSGAAVSGVWHAVYLFDLSTRASVLDTWSFLSAVALATSVAAIASAGWCLLKRRWRLALLLSLVRLPAQFVIGGSRCDTESACRVLGWAALPPPAFEWSIRLRPVRDSQEAEDLAAEALAEARSSGGAFRIKKFGDHWIVSIINDDGWPTGKAVRIDARTGRGRLIDCPPERIQCGMSRAVISDGRQVFGDPALGLAARFPASSPVCTARTEDDGEPLGFFTARRSLDIPCEVLDQSRHMGIEIARSPREGCVAKDAPDLPWTPLSSATSRVFREPGLKLSSLPSTVCELHDGGFIQISVFASASSQEPPVGDTTRLIEAYVVTTPEHLVADARAFEAFVAEVVIDNGTLGRP